MWGSGARMLAFEIVREFESAQRNVEDNEPKPQALALYELNVQHIHEPDLAYGGLNFRQLNHLDMGRNGTKSRPNR